MSLKKVRILTNGRIPFMGGNGPILTPVNMEEKTIEIMRKLGIKIEIVEDVPPAIEPLDEKVMTELEPLVEEAEGVMVEVEDEPEPEPEVDDEPEPEEEEEDEPEPEPEEEDEPEPEEEEPAPKAKKAPAKTTKAPAKKKAVAKPASKKKTK